MKTIILLDDTQNGGKVLFRELSEKYPGRYELHHAYSVSEFSKVIEKFDEKAVFVIGLYLCSGPEEDGLRYIRDLRKSGCKNPIFVWSKLAFKFRRKAHDAGADKVFEKFVEDEKLLKAIMDEPYIDDEVSQMDAYDLQSRKERKEFRRIFLVMTPLLILDLLWGVVVLSPFWAPFWVTFADIFGWR